MSSTYAGYRANGFTLLEVLLSIGIITILVGLSLPVYASFTRRNDLSLTTQSVAAMLRRAEAYSRAVRGGHTWSVEIQPTAVILFQGATFVGRPTAYDETINLPSTVTDSGLTEVNFSRMTAVPNVTGTITFTNGNDTGTITLNAKGMVDY